MWSILTLSYNFLFHHFRSSHLATLGFNGASENSIFSSAIDISFRAQSCSPAVLILHEKIRYDTFEQFYMLLFIYFSLESSYLLKCVLIHLCSVFFGHMSALWLHQGSKTTLDMCLKFFTNRQSKGTGIINQLHRMLHCCRWCGILLHEFLRIACLA